MNDSRHPENAEGDWYVNDQCISCRLCGELMPESFREANDGSQYIVYRQPEEHETKKITETADSCPVEAICCESIET